MCICMAYWWILAVQTCTATQIVIGNTLFVGNEQVMIGNDRSSVPHASRLGIHNLPYNRDTMNIKTLGRNLQQYIQVVGKS